MCFITCNKVVFVTSGSQNVRIWCSTYRRGAQGSQAICWGIHPFATYLHSAYTVHTLCLHGTYIVPTLYIHHDYTVPTFWLHCIYIVAHYTYTVPTLYLHCTYIVAHYTYCAHTVPALYLHCTRTFTTQMSTFKFMYWSFEVFIKVIDLYNKTMRKTKSHNLGLKVYLMQRGDGSALPSFCTHFICSWKNEN